MEKEKTAVFIGHRECYRLSEEVLNREIIKLIDKGVDTFLNGGMGGFDSMCMKSIIRLKNMYSHIKHYLVIPNPDFKGCDFKNFDEVIYPGLEKYQYRYAIPKRNKWMVNNAGFAVCYVNHGFGGCINTYRNAIKSGLEMVNLGTYPLKGWLQ